MKLYKAALVMVLVGSLIGLVAYTWRWPLVGDAPLFHYVVFLMQHGMAPYRQIADVNLPGTYAAEALVMRWMGTGALAWRVYDLGLVALIGLGMAALCPPRQRAFAGLFAGSLFALLHARDGLIDTGQRDLLGTALLVGGYVFLFRSLLPPPRNRALAYGASAAFGLLLGAAATVKPNALLLLGVLLPLVVFARRRMGQTWAGQVAAMLLGAAVPVIGVAWFLFRWHALAAFGVAMRSLAPLHASVLRLPWPTLVGRSVSSVMLPLFVLWLPVAWARRGWQSVEGAALWVGFLFGVSSFCLQGRGYAYHRYPLEAFLLVLMARDLPAALALQSRPRWAMGTAALALAVGALWIVPRSLAVAAHYTYQRDGFNALLQPALEARGGAALSGKVQCLDMAGGCISTLYRMRLLPSTGYLYDCYLFVPVTGTREQAEQERYRAAFLQAVTTARPRYLIVTSDECGITPADFRYSKLTRWPGFAGWLAARYGLVAERRPTEPEAWEGRAALPYGFRLYERTH